MKLRFYGIGGELKTDAEQYGFIPQINNPPDTPYLRDKVCFILDVKGPRFMEMVIEDSLNTQVIINVAP